MSSELSSILQEWADKQPLQPVTDAALGRALGVTRQTVGNWRAGLSRLPEPHQLRKVATLTGTPYQAVLEAALVDAGYLNRERLTDETPIARGAIGTSGRAPKATSAQRHERVKTDRDL